MKKTAMILLAAVFAATLHADVFSLWPFSGSGSAASDALNASQLWKENVRINDQNMELKVSLIRADLKELLKNFKGQGRRVAMNSNSLLVEETLPNGHRRRLYFVEVPGFAYMIRFSMELPPSDKLHKIANWPEKFPLPSGATPVSVMEFPRRDASYASFRCAAGTAQLVGECDAQLRAAGWQSFGKASETSRTTGDVYLRKDSSEILILTVMPEDNNSGYSTGAYFLRKNLERP